MESKDTVITNNVNNSRNKILDQEAIKSIIPHRYEFLLIENVEILTSGTEAIGHTEIKEDSWFFKGHFPEYKIMPGVLIIESMAQTAAVCTLEALDGNSENNHQNTANSNKEPTKSVFFIKIENATFRKPILPNTKLFYHIKLQKKLRTFYTFECTAFFFQDERKIISTTANIMATM